MGRNNRVLSEQLPARRCVRCGGLVAERTTMRPRNPFLHGVRPRAACMDCGLEPALAGPEPTATALAGPGAQPGAGEMPRRREQHSAQHLLATAQSSYEEPHVSTRPACRRRVRLRRRIGRAALGILFLIVALGFTAPLVMVWVGTQRARACIAQIEGERGSDLPVCMSEARWMIPPAHVPWTSWTARYRAEELYARTSVAAYVDAAIGSPDPSRLVVARAGVQNAEKTVKTGSGRVAMDELGPAVGPPTLGSAAVDLGDRATLLLHADAWDNWHVRLHALDAAFVEGDTARAVAVARRLAAFDPRDEDLRTTVAATLCLGDATARGIEMLDSTQNDRASRRYAAMARDWGEVRVVIEACAARAGAAPPQPPEHADAGQQDAAEARAVLRSRVTRTESQDPEERRVRSEHLAHVADLLTKEPRSRVGRRALLAALAASEQPLTVERAITVATPSPQGEPPLMPDSIVTPASLFEEPRPLRPVVAPATYTDGAKRLLALTERSSEPEARVLRVAAGALLLEAGREFALAGDAGAASAATDAAGELVLPPGAARALARSTALWVSGDHEQALAQLDRADAAAIDPRVVAATLVQRSELLASLGRTDEAAAAAVVADDAARRAGDPVVGAHARWVRLALANAGERLRETWPEGHPEPAFQWLGYADPTAPWSNAAGEPALRSTLAAWALAIDSSPERRRALRYAVLDLRGDAPPWPVALLHVAARLAAGSGDVETWLDAFFAYDGRILSRRANAWARAEAARWRGDAGAAALWTQRLAGLRSVASEPSRAEIARYLGL